MCMLARGFIIAMSLLVASSVAAEYGKVRLPGDATIKHDGDYIVYDLKFESNCYTDEQESISEVSNNVVGFVAWLNDKAHNFNDGSIEQWVNLISTSRDGNPFLFYYYDSDPEERVANPCYEKYSTTQSISVRVIKSDSIPSVTRGMVVRPGHMMTA